METPIESTSGHSLQEIMKKKTVFSPVPAFLRVNLRATNLHHLWEVITFVRLATCSRDGAGCGAGNACCTFNTPPWFYKQLSHPTTDDIEMRVCTDDPRNTEDIAIEIIEIYIQ
jgi:hypothetical protein